MNISKRIRIQRKIRKMYGLMRKTMDDADVVDSTATIKIALHQLPKERKEGLIDACLEVLKNE